MKRILEFPSNYLAERGLPTDTMNVLAFLAGADAKAHSEQRVVPDNWQPYKEAWALGYDHTMNRRI